MNSKEKILARLAADAMPSVAYPEPGFEPQCFDDLTTTFAERLKAAGGEAVVMSPGETLDEIIHRYYASAQHIASTLGEVGVATCNPDEVVDPRELVDIDLAVVEGIFGVAENGAVWVPQDVRHKALYFGATALMIVIPKGALEATMHQAVIHPEVGDFGYGCFISGPSKTADIEQALVFGAHGAMTATVVIRN